MIKNLIVMMTLFIGVVFAKERLTPQDKERFLGEVKQEIAEHKIENKGLVDLQIIKPAFYAELEQLVKEEKLTRDEALAIRQKYEQLSKDKSITAYNAEQAFYTFLEAELSKISATALNKLKEGDICNTWSCESGLKCAPTPVQEGTDKLKKAGTTCLEDSECLSNECVVEKVGSKKKVCEEVYRCFKVLNLGESCAQNPVCGAGTCLPYDLLTSGIGECEVKGKVCKANSDCCSNLCKGGSCQENYICKDCVNKGSKPTRGQKCCEGLYLNEKGICAPDVPPMVIPQVNASPFKNFFIAVSDFFFSQARADEMVNEIKSGKAQYSNFIPTKAVDETLADKNIKTVKTNIKFSSVSNFETCSFNFKHDFYNSLVSKNQFEVLAAIVAFDFVVTGDSENDYWTQSKSNPSTSIVSRLKKVGQDDIVKRKELNETFVNMDKKLSCMCLDVKGYGSISDATKKKFFETECEEYKKYAEGAGTSADQLTPDASSLRAKELLIYWTDSLVKLYEGLTVTMVNSNDEIGKVSKWVNEAKWDTATQKNYDLFKFNIKNPSSSIAGLGAITGALLAAAVIAVLGGFATSSLLSAWAAAGIIAVSAMGGAGGLWAIASLKGAWITMRPEITDSSVAPRSYSCGKKETCMEYTRTLLQPYNNICDIHASANACLKSFVVVNEKDGPRYIVDPWIPVGVSRVTILKNQPLYTSQLEQGFQAAKAAMISKNPGADGGGGKKGGGEFISESYLSEVFIDANIVGKYIPLSGNAESLYFMSDDKVKAIKEAAKKFAISENFLQADDIANLEAFADYAYEYHFLWPKKSRPGEISYPTVSLATYIEYMRDAVNGVFAADAANTATDWRNLNTKYVTDYQKTLQDLLDNPINQTNSLLQTDLKKKLDKINQDLLNKATIKSLIDNDGSGLQLSTLTKATVADKLKGSGLGGVNNFSDGQISFLNAVGKLRTLRKEQLKSLDQYNKSMASSGNSDRAAKMTSASKKFSDKFSSGVFAMGSNRYSTGSNGANANGSNGASANGSGKDANSKNGYGADGSNSWGGSGGTVYNLGRSGSGGSRSGSNSGSGSNGNGSGTIEENAADAENSKLAEAILARNQANKNKYESSDEQTLFEKVTNAYIRNYDKVLSKKKDKDVIEGSK